jgi:hypothetical protein
MHKMPVVVPPGAKLRPISMTGSKWLGGTKATRRNPREMAITKTIEAPEWVDSGSELTGGLDLLGLRIPVQTIGGALLDGVTTVSPSIRYIGLRAWLIHRYAESRRPDSWREFTDFAGYVESALVLGNLTSDRSIYGLIGTDEGLLRLDASSDKVKLSSLVKTPAATVYAGPSDQLGVSWNRDDKVPGLFGERGKPLAFAVEETLGKLSLIGRLFDDHPPEEISREDLSELGEVARIDRIPGKEREALLVAVIPEKPLSRERARIGTYTALLTLAKQKGAVPAEADLFNAACSYKRFGEPLLDPMADGWLTYCVRDAIAVSHEAVLAAVMGEVTLGADGGKAGMEGDAVVQELMARVEEHNPPMRDLKLLGADESALDLSFKEFYGRVEALLGRGLEQEKGIARWTAAVDEQVLCKAALRAGAGALSLAVLSRIMATIRVGGAVREDVVEFGNLSYQGRRRLGLREVILPGIAQLLADDPPFRDVAAAFAYQVVHQHLQIAWSRLQVDPQRDVALLTAEGKRWYSRGKTYSGGRTQSRLQQAIGWMQQLGLVDADGLTADGEAILTRALKVLSEGATT